MPMDSTKENIESCTIFLFFNFLHAHILYNKSEAAMKQGNLFWIQEWANFVDQANISKVMVDLVWRDFVKFQ